MPRRNTRRSGIPREPSLRLGTDCTGIDAPLAALCLLGVHVEYVFSSEVDEDVPDARIQTAKIQYTDLMKRDNATAPKVDLYVAGFPCQTYSGLSGNCLGLEDPRGQVMWGVIDYIKQRKPNMFLLENVRTFLSHQEGAAWALLQKEIAECLTPSGKPLYTMRYKVMSPSDIGFPQRRPRVFIVGIKTSFLPSADEESMWPSKATVPICRVRDLLLTKKEAMHVYPDAFRQPPPSQQKLLDTVMAMASGKKRDLQKETMVLDLKRTRKGAAYVPPDPDVVPCLHRGCRSFYVTRLQRYITPVEAMRFQGFPDDFLDQRGSTSVRDTERFHSKLFAWAGNSMCVPLVAAILRPYLQHMNYI